MRIGTEHLSVFIQMLKQDREKLIEELVQNLDHEKTALLRGNIQQIDSIIRDYPERIKQQ